MQDTFIEKKCSNCKIGKTINFFPKRGDQCKSCQKEKRLTVKDKKQQYDHKYRSTNKEKLLQQQQIYDRANREKIKIYKKQHVKQKRADDPIFRLRSYVSKYITTAIKLRGAKRDGSCLQYLPFSINKLKNHLETQFESWMNWDNQGKYNSATWNDNDSSTWVWQLDHIMPQSDLPYTSMEDENFKKCWSLENLRPLSAKQNLMDGVTKVRHNLVVK